MAVELVGIHVPTPIVASLMLFIIGVILISDAGAGAPLIFPFLRPFLQPYKPTAAYERLKSKYM
jgi:hypothetical protein